MKRVDSINELCQNLNRCGIDDIERRTSEGPIKGNDEDEQLVCTAVNDLEMMNDLKQRGLEF